MAPVLFYYALAKGQPDTRTREYLFAVQPSEELEDPLVVRLFDTNAVV